MKSRKGVQLVMAAVIGLILLIIFLVFFITGGFGTISDLFGESQDAADTGETSLVAAKAKCKAWCLEADSSEKVSDWKDSRFCSEKLLLGEEMTRYCAEDPISATCSNAVTEDVMTGTGTNEGEIVKCTELTMCGANTDTATATNLCTLL